MVAAVIKLGFGVLARNPVDGGLDRLLQGLSGAGLRLAQLGFELAPGLLDGREVGRVGRHKQHFDPAPSQGLL